MKVFKKIIASLPYAAPFLFVDELLEVNEKGSKGKYRFHADLPFYKGHFKDYPVTPGAIVTECCAQIGLVCLGIYLLKGQFKEKGKIALTSVEMEFLTPVFPNETVFVKSEKIYFRFNKLKCKVKMTDKEGNLVCKGVLAGILKTTDA